MQVNLVSCIFVLDSEENDNIRKNDVKKLKIIVDNNNELPTISVGGNEIKKQVRHSISNIIGSSIFHLEQVYTMDYKNDLDIIYLCVTNIDSIVKLKKDYKLVDFKIINNSLIVMDNKEFKYKTVELVDNNNIEYIHDIKTKDEQVKRVLLDILISYKRIRNSIDNTDIIFKFFGESFTLEDVRIVYELIKDCSVDKSNFRKKIIKYCEKIDSSINKKSGFRPSQRFKFKPLKGDAWL